VCVCVCVCVYVYVYACVSECASNILENKFFNCPELLFSNEFSYLVSIYFIKRPLYIDICIIPYGLFVKYVIYTRKKVLVI
jgi:hypothetical protein